MAVAELISRPDEFELCVSHIKFDRNDKGCNLEARRDSYQQHRLSHYALVGVAHDA
jgi:hypothetical protein